MEQSKLTFTNTSHAKWILCGEHSVVRGGKAIVFPLRNLRNTVNFCKKETLIIENDSQNEIFELLKIGAKYLNIPISELYGQFDISSDIPIKAGLGSSAALCVNIAKIFAHFGFCKDVFQLARHLENKFHKKSSGLDIAVCLFDRPIIFRDGKVVEFLEPAFWPYMALTYSGKTSSTSMCIQQLQKLFNENEKHALELDSLMNNAVNLCEKGFKKANFNLLKDGIKLSKKVFTEWGLCNDELNIHMQNLIDKGAVAVKPVGSGLGGYVLSLWEENPNKYLDICLTLQKP
ncbi:MAG: hypothetical protein K6C34_02705 [Alphaproteobacteria bacterium]|nr:hypothetical protein [Alphaproteobacteria bacterium]